MLTAKQNLEFPKANISSLSYAMRQSLASLRLEGIELSEEAMADLRLFDAGQLSKGDVLKQAIERARA